jgi:ABC-type proline/glycine betaine transport system permease subunit
MPIVLTLIAAVWIGIPLGLYVARTDLIARLFSGHK